ncbi:cyclase family protein [Gryllotalpicola protaetiae]|uniref:Cyclase family protein n=1 Tax=Gryllotalpicola protaetiae TaxID=2419771 RepID=A0A387BVT3_9MICO|nr:cyclase family protein [Gryllotalpicola protaetiae]AYG05236.1 cyclase family protein [Gryllotalpicola protaetiae]
MTDYRAVFDAHISFVNGGSLSADGFRLDLPSDAISEAEIGRLLVQHLGLALVADVRLENLQVIEEQHRGSRGVEPLAAVATADFRLVELSHTIREGMVTLPGIPSPGIRPHLTREQAVERYAPGTTFVMDVIDLAGNTGTYLDTPFHRYEGGSDLAATTLETLVDLPAEVFHLTDADARGIPASVFFDREVRGKAVLLHTGWDRHFGSPEYATDAPFLAPGGVAYLAEHGVTLVGIDSQNIDDTEADAGGERPEHSVFLAAGIHVVEHLTGLGELPPSGALFTAVPPRVEGFGTFPVRAFAKVPA